MRDGYDLNEGEDGASAGLDEFLCEYVDGTMDSAVRAAFEEYLRQNPHLYEHIECLREARSMLCRYGCRLRAPAALQQRLRERLSAELQDPQPVFSSASARLSWLAGFSSLVLLVCGFWAAQSQVPPPGETIARADVGVADVRTTMGYLVPRAAVVEARSSAAALAAPVFNRRLAWQSTPLPRDTFLTRIVPADVSLPAMSSP